MKKKTPEDIAALKARWLADPYWVLENTAGFEAHRGELKRFRIAWHEQEETMGAALQLAIEEPPPSELNPE